MGRKSNAKEKLINSVIELIGTRSYNSVGVQEICEHAGVKKGSFYHFFPSKPDLTVAALDAMWKYFEEHVLFPTINSDLPPKEKFQRFIELCYQLQCTTKEATGCMTGCHIGNLALEMSTQDEVIQYKVQQIFQQWVSHFEIVIREAVAEGELPPETNPTSTAHAMIAYIEGILLLGKTFNDPSIIKRLSQGALQLAITGDGSKNKGLYE